MSIWHTACMPLLDFMGATSCHLEAKVSYFSIESKAMSIEVYCSTLMLGP